MLSIVKTVNRLDKMEAMHRAALDSYSEVLRATAEYPVQVDATEAHMFQQHIQALREMLERCNKAEISKRFIRHSAARCASTATK